MEPVLADKEVLLTALNIKAMSFGDEGGEDEDMGSRGDESEVTAATSDENQVPEIQSGGVQRQVRYRVLLITLRVLAETLKVDVDVEIKLSMSMSTHRTCLDYPGISIGTYEVCDPGSSLDMNIFVSRNFCLICNVTLFLTHPVLFLCSAELHSG